MQDQNTPPTPAGELMSFPFAVDPVRVLRGANGETLFVGKDVCDALGYADATNAMKRHCHGISCLRPIQTARGVQEVRVLTEAEVIRLLVHSKLPSARAFDQLVFEDVLPSIRRTGRHEAPGAGAQPVEPKRQIAQGDSMDQAMRNAEGLIQLAISQIDPATAASRMPGLSRPDVAMGLAGILLRTQRFLLEFDDIEHPSLRLLHPKEKIVSVHGDVWAERFVATLDREQLKQLMQAAVQRLA